MRPLALATTDPAAQLAVEVYCYRARKYVGAYLAVLGGVDAVLFGGGVGENMPEIRRRILGPLEAFGLRLDPEANLAARGVAARISPEPSPAAVWVLPVDEARLLARATAGLLAKA
jgi:acetate kinase